MQADVSTIDTRDIKMHFRCRPVQHNPKNINQLMGLSE